MIGPKKLIDFIQIGLLIAIICVLLADKRKPVAEVAEDVVDTSKSAYATISEAVEPTLSKAPGFPSGNFLSKSGEYIGKQLQVQGEKAAELAEKGRDDAEEKINNIPPPTIPVKPVGRKLITEENYNNTLI